MSKGNGNSELSRELKDLIDRVVVPALVREYLGELLHVRESQGACPDSP